VTDVPEPTAVDASDGDASDVPSSGGSSRASTRLSEAAATSGVPASSVRAVDSVRPAIERRGARIKVSKLGKSYIHGGKALPILWDIDLTLDPGAMVAVVGASGVGKSTFLQLLGTLDLPTSGSIRFDGEELTTMSASRLAEFRNRRIGFVFQFHHLLPEFTALENVMMPALIQRIATERARKMASDILGRVGLSHRLTHRPAELSGGEQQRVALARAMVLEPSLLLADEPTGNLDRSTGEAIHQLFLDLNRERGSTLLVVTHNPDLAAILPRRLRMIDGGRLIEEDAPPYRSGTHAAVAASDPVSPPDAGAVP
jgi:lipoprotein-releasing system ATP-binding protein